MSSKGFPASEEEEEEGEGPAATPGAPGRGWVAAGPSKAPWENGFVVGRAVSAGNPQRSAVGVAGRGGFVRVPLLQRVGDMIGVGQGRKMRVMLHAGDERVNPRLFPPGSPWVKPFTSSASSSVKWATLLKEVYRPWRAVGGSSRALRG